VEVESEPGRGSLFVVQLPFEVGSLADAPGLSSEGLSRLLGTSVFAAPADGAQPAQAPRPIRVLLVEDNPVNQRLAYEILRRRGHVVTVAENGRQALERLAAGTFEIVLMDVQMPEMNGLEATRAIRAAERQTGQHLPIVAMTAHAMAGDRERCLAAGMDEYLTKPIRAEALISHVERTAMSPPSPGTPGASDVVFDLHEALQRVDGDRDLLAEVADIFLTDAPGMLQDVVEAVQQNDAEAVGRTAHRIKGSILTFAAPAAANVALKLEQGGRIGDLSSARADVERLDLEVQRLSRVLRGLIDSRRKTA
jgi:CheY-like chemotaxis protein